MFHNVYGPSELLSFGLLATVGGSLFLLLLIWSLVWKGLALWRAAREGSKEWFVALLVINTAGILEILYLYVFSKKANKE